MNIKNNNNNHFSHSLSHSNKVTLEPYIGPRPFNRNNQDQKRFFGRDYETEEIVSLIVSSKLVLIYAPSGSGKTSLFNAQIIPTLEKDRFDILPMARVKVSSNIIYDQLSYSSEISNVYIFNALTSLKPDIDANLLKNKSLSEFLNEYYPIRRYKNNDEIPQILIFDQLE